MTLKICILTAEQLAPWKQMRLQALKEHPHAYGSSYEEELPRTDDEWLRSLKTGDMFGCFLDDELVAFAGFYANKGVKRRHRATVFNIYVKEAFRGKRITDLLLNAISHHARAQKIEQLHLDVGDYNIPAISCYERNGFVLYGTTPHALKWQGTYINEHMMVKYL